MAAQTATSPWIALSFGIFQPVGIIATIATAFLVEAIMVLGLVSALACSVFAPLAGLTAPLSQLLLRLLSESMSFFSRLPSLALPAETERSLQAVAVVGLGLFIYALPYVQYRAWRRRIRFGADEAHRAS
jgi:predicted membrane metal-binding protein